MVSKNINKDIGDTIQTIDLLTNSLVTSTDKPAIVEKLQVAAEHLKNLTEEFLTGNDQEFQDVLNKTDGLLNRYNQKIDEKVEKLGSLSLSLSQDDVSRLVDEIQTEVGNDLAGKLASIHVPQGELPHSAQSRNIKKVSFYPRVDNTWNQLQSMNDLYQQIISLPDEVTNQSMVALYNQINALPEDKAKNSSAKSVESATKPTTNNKVMATPKSTTPNQSSNNFKESVLNLTKNTAKLSVNALGKTLQLIGKSINFLLKSVVYNRLLPLIKQQLNSTNKRTIDKDNFATNSFKTEYHKQRIQDKPKDNLNPVSPKPKF